MSKISAKNRYTQLMSWLETRNNKIKASNPKKQSRIEYYKNKGNNKSL